MYHLVVLPGFESLKMSDRPDGSYGTKDLFKPHPDNLPGNDTRSGVAKWKFVARQGDIVVLVNGENADPSPIEQAVMLDPHVQMAVAFGAGHERLGLLVIPSDKAQDMSREEVIQRLLPALEHGNKLAADYAKISPDDIIVKPVGTPYPQTAKMTLQRHVVNKEFADDIEAHYATRETTNVKGKVMSDNEIRDVVRQVVCQVLQDRGSVFWATGTNEQSTHQGHGLDDDSDFFSRGMDSLQSSLVRGRLLREISLSPGATLATNVVFEYPTVKLLSEHILHLRQTKWDQNGPKPRDPESIAKEMVTKYAALVTSEVPGYSSTTAPEPSGKSGISGHVIVSALPIPSHSLTLLLTSSPMIGSHGCHRVHWRATPQSPPQPAGRLVCLLPRSHPSGTGRPSRGGAYCHCPQQHSPVRRARLSQDVQTEMPQLQSRCSRPWLVSYRLSRD